MENLGIQIHEQSSETPQVIICEESSSRHKQLEELLKEMFCKAVKDLCNEYKTEKKNNPPSSDDDISMRPKLFVSIQRPDDSDVGDLALALTEGDGKKKHLGRKIKNSVTGEKVVDVDIPEDFDVGCIQNIEEIKDRLGKWRIQRRQRESNMNDTYYCHLISRQTFRSIPEVLNFIMRGILTKTCPKRSHSDMASTSQGDNMMMVPYKPPSKKQKKDKGKMALPSERFMSHENSTFLNSELSMVPWIPLDSETMNMYFSHLSSSQIQYWRPEPEANPRGDKNKVTLEIKDNFVDLTEDSDDENGIYSNLEMMTEVTLDNKYYCHQSSMQVQYWTPEPSNFMLYESEANPSREKEKKVTLEMNENNFVDLTEDSDDENNGIFSNLEMITEVTTLDKVDNSIMSESALKKGIEDIGQVTIQDQPYDVFESLNDLSDLLGGMTFEDLMGKGKGKGTGITPHANENIIGKGNFPENQAYYMTTKPVESLAITESSNKQNQNFLVNCGAAGEFSTLEEAMQKLAGVELEGVDDDHFQHGFYFPELDPVNYHILDYDYDYEAGIEFLFRD